MTQMRYSGSPHLLNSAESGFRICSIGIPEIRLSQCSHNPSALHLSEHRRASRDAFGGSGGGCIVPHLHVSVFCGWAIPVRSNAWRPEMPSAPDWRSTAVYAYMNELDSAEFAWECLRRNLAYKRDYRTAVGRMASGHA